MFAQIKDYRRKGICAEEEGGKVLPSTKNQRIRTRQNISNTSRRKKKKKKKGRSNTKDSTKCMQLHVMGDQLTTTHYIIKTALAFDFVSSWGRVVGRAFRVNDIIWHFQKSMLLCNLFISSFSSTSTFKKVDD